MNSSPTIPANTEAGTKLIDQVVHSAETALHSAEQAAHGVANGIADSTRRVRQTARDATDTATHYIQREPIKAVLIAAAAGAALMALLTLARHSRS